MYYIFFKASPIRIATCNLHGNHIKSGITTLIPAIRLRHMIAANSQVCNHHGTGTASNSNTNTTCSGKSLHRYTFNKFDCIINTKVYIPIFYKYLI